MKTGQFTICTLFKVVKSANSEMRWKLSALSELATPNIGFANPSN